MLCSLETDPENCGSRTESSFPHELLLTTRDLRDHERGRGHRRGGETRALLAWPTMRSGQSHREKDMPTSCHDMLRNRRDPGALEQCWELRIRRGPSGSALEPAGPGTDSRGLPGGGGEREEGEEYNKGALGPLWPQSERSVVTRRAGDLFCPIFPVRTGGLDPGESVTSWARTRQGLCPGLRAEGRS